MNRHSKNIEHRNAGFTLIELLIVIAISALLTSLVVIYSNTGRNEVSLSVESVTLAQTIARAKSLAIASYRTGNPNAPHLCAYGVTFDAAAETYSLVAYEPSSGSATCPSAGTVNASGVLGSDLSAESVATWQQPLANGVRFAGNAPQTTFVLFYPPDPATLISQNICTPGDGGCEYGFTPGPGTVTLETSDGAASDTLTIGIAGQISF